MKTIFRFLWKRQNSYRQYQPTKQKCSTMMRRSRRFYNFGELTGGKSINSNKKSVRFNPVVQVFMIPPRPRKFRVVVIPAAKPSIKNYNIAKIQK